MLVCAHMRASAFRIRLNFASSLFQSHFGSDSTAFRHSMLRRVNTHLGSSRNLCRITAHLNALKQAGRICCEKINSPQFFSQQMSLTNSTYRLSQSRPSVNDAWRVCSEHRHATIQFGQTMGFVHIHNELGHLHIFFRLHASNDVFQSLNLERISRRHISLRLPWGELGRFKIVKGTMCNCLNDEYVLKVLTLDTDDRDSEEPTEKSSTCARFRGWRRFVLRSKHVAALIVLHKYNITEVELRRSIIVKSGLLLDDNRTGNFGCDTCRGRCG